MPFALKRGCSVGVELRRLLDRQLSAAVDALQGGPGDVRVARRRLKKARAVLRAARPGLDDASRSIDRQLRKAGHLLAPLADAAAAISTLDRLRGIDPARLADARIAALRAALCSDAARLRSGSANLRGRAIRLLTKQREALAGFETSACGVHSTAGAVRRARRNGRVARRHAMAHPTMAACHAWRRRVKVEWHLLRLLDGVTRRRLIEDERRLEQLDGCLGDLHDLAVLQVRVREHSALSRSATAQVLMAIRAHARDLKQCARLLAGALDESPRELERRIVALWLSARAPVGLVEGEARHSHA